LEMNVAEAALAALRNQQFLAMRGQVADDLIGIDVDDSRADRHPDRGVLTAAAIHVAAHAVLATLCLELALVAEVDQRVQAFVGDQPHAATLAAVAAVGTTERNELLAPETGAPIAAVAGLHFDVGFVDEFHGRQRNENRGQSALSNKRPGAAAGAARKCTLTPNVKSPARSGAFLIALSDRVSPRPRSPCAGAWGP